MFLSCVIAVMAQNPEVDTPGSPVALTPEIPAVARPTYNPGIALDLSADGKTVVGSFSLESHRQFLRFRDLETGAILHDIPIGKFRYIRSVKLAPDGKTVAVALEPENGGQIVRIVGVKDGLLVREFGRFDGAVEIRGFSADGTKLVTLDHAFAGKKRDAKPRLDTWDIATGKKLDTAEAKLRERPEAVTPDGTVRAKFGDNNTIIIEREGQKPFVITATRGGNYHNLFLTPDVKRVIVASYTGAEVCDTTTGEKLRVIQNDTQTITSIATADGGKLLFVGVVPNQAARNPDPNAGSVYVWDTTKPELKAVIAGFGNDLWQVQPTTDGKRLTVICGGSWRVSRVEVWDTTEKKKLHSLGLHQGGLGWGAVSSDGQWVAHSSAEKDMVTVQVWNTETAKLAEEVTKAATGTPGSLAFTPDSKRLIVASFDAYSEWDVLTGKPGASWRRRQGDKDEPVRFASRGHTAGATPLPGGKGVLLVAATGKRRQSYTVELMTEKKDWFLGEFWDYASSPVVSANGQWLAIVGGGSREQEAMLLKLNADGSPELMKKPERHWGPVYDGDKVIAWRTWPLEAFGYHSLISFSPDGQRLFTGGITHAISIWDTESRTLQATLYVVPPAKPGDIPKDWVIFTPAGNYVGTPLGEQTLRFREANVATWFGWSSVSAVPATDFPQLRDPGKVKTALGVK